MKPRHEKLDLVRFILPVVSAIYWIGLTLWIAVVVSAGVAAGFVFGKLPSMGVTLDRFEHYDQSEHGRLAAGMVMEPVFAFVDLAQVAAGLVVVIAMVIQFLSLKSSLKRIANWMRVLCVLIVVMLFIIRITAIAPNMNRELRAYWSAAQAGQVELAEKHRAAFNQLHPIATSMLQVTLGLLLVCVAVSASACAPASPLRKARSQLKVLRLRDQT